MPIKRIVIQPTLSQEEAEREFKGKYLDRSHYELRVSENMMGVLPDGEPKFVFLRGVIKPKDVDEFWLGFEVSMDNPLIVGRNQCVGELRTRIVRCEASPSQLLPPRAAFNELINNEAPPTLLDEVIHRGDTWMAQGGSGAGFGC